MYYKRNTYGGEKNMKPRIFVSSTFYDLRSIREDISLFIKQFEYGIYKSNLNNVQADQIRYRATEDTNIFRFIDEIYKLSSITVTAFDKTQEIKDYLQIQWAALFKKYVNGLRDDKRISSIENAMLDMKELIKKMELMVNTIGKKVLEEEPEAYDDVVKNQNIQLLCDKIISSFKFANSPIGERDRKEYLLSFLNYLVELYNEGKWYSMDELKNKKVTEEFYSLLNRSKYEVVFYMYNFIEVINLLKICMSKEESKEQIIDTMERENWYLKMKSGFNK